MIYGGGGVICVNSVCANNTGSHRGQVDLYIKKIFIVPITSLILVATVCMPFSGKQTNKQQNKKPNLINPDFQFSKI